MSRSQRKAPRHGIPIEKRITSIEELKQEADGEADFALLLQFGLFSRKTIRYDDATKLFSIWNHIDDTGEELTEDELRKTNIGRAIRKGHFVKFAEDPA